MTKTQKDTLANAVVKMAEQAVAASNESQKALHFTQASLNLANTIAQIESIDKSK